MVNEDRDKNAMEGCPRCNGKITVTRIHCKKCNITTDFPENNDFLPRIAMLPKRDMYFIQLFLELDGNIKAVSEALEISIPTVKNRLESVKRFLRE